MQTVVLTFSSVRTADDIH